eukprot:CAMPEP_0181220586 /NCGR_PEP_ID=MMETSP1096-20121128/28920_1 /TAXON_ID=156174 ORGANISM="Chrysochromulina ericina, Strain CCMP281" /NCGR_SAMPLE_ID=MMETSP1096 /ASSEMBLY_ACC=CAM_ASM_000453 /LENGTH=72 /DNA_ID=CAMNT_0023313107 /DNA_START=93 /DNA_END=311 /DNA_ORIENTATION=+
MCRVCQALQSARSQMEAAEEVFEVAESFSVRSYLRQLTPILAEAFKAMEKQDPENPVNWMASFLDERRQRNP